MRQIDFGHGKKKIMTSTKEVYGKIVIEYVTKILQIYDLPYVISVMCVVMDRCVK